MNWLTIEWAVIYLFICIFLTGNLSLFIDADDNDEATGLLMMLLWLLPDSNELVDNDEDNTFLELLLLFDPTADVTDDANADDDDDDVDDELFFGLTVRFDRHHGSYIFYDRSI